MAVEPTGHDLGSGPALLDQLIWLLLQVTGEDEQWAAGITPGSQLEADLRIESVEVVALGALLAEVYGDHVDLPGFLASLDFDQLIGLTVGDLASHLAAGQIASRAGVHG